MTKSISLSISIREPKRLQGNMIDRDGISLSISIREPKLDGTYYDIDPVSVYQYPSENQNYDLKDMARVAYQFINIHQRTKTSEMKL